MRAAVSFFACVVLNTRRLLLCAAVIGCGLGAMQTARSHHHHHSSGAGAGASVGGGGGGVGLRHIGLLLFLGVAAGAFLTTLMAVMHSRTTPNTATATAAAPAACEPGAAAGSTTGALTTLLADCQLELTRVHSALNDVPVGGDAPSVRRAPNAPPPPLRRRVRRAPLPLPLRRRHRRWRRPTCRNASDCLPNTTSKATVRPALHSVFIRIGISVFVAVANPIRWHSLRQT